MQTIKVSAMTAGCGIMPPQLSNGKSCTKFTTKDGLHQNGVFCIPEDKAGNIWAGIRNTGVCRYDPKQAIGKAYTNFVENAPKQ